MWQAAVIIFNIIVFVLCLIGLGTIIFFVFTFLATAEEEKGSDNTEADIDSYGAPFDEQLYDPKPYKEEIFR